MSFGTRTAGTENKGEQVKWGKTKGIKSQNRRTMKAEANGEKTDEITFQFNFGKTTKTE